MKNCTDLDSWLTAIADRHTPNIHLGLERILVLAEKLKLTTFDCPVITVAGTNGKGTTVAALQRLYTHAGYRVGSYYSPHLHHFTERLIIDNESVSEAEWCDAFKKIQVAVADLPLTFFEFITLAALLILKNQNLDCVILEVGLGGRLDAVNCVENDLAIITQIALDHCDRLGYDRESIGFEKAGIFRKNKIALSADSSTPDSVIEHAAALNCFLYQAAKDYELVISETEWSWVSEFGQWHHCPLPKIPVSSAATALTVSYILADRLKVSDTDRVEAIKNTQLPGRFEIIQDRCPLIFDVAHNEAAALLLAKRFSQISGKGRRYAIFSVLADKDCSAIVKAMAEHIHEWHIIPLQTPRAENTQKIVEEVTAIVSEPCYPHESVNVMWKLLRDKLCSEDRVIIFGSFYTVAAVQSWIERYREESSSEYPH